MATKSLTATIFGVDKASSVFEKVGGKAKETSSKFVSGAKAAAGALGAIGVVSFFKDSITAFTEAQAQTAKLEDAFAKFPRLGDSTAAAIEKISAALEAKTVYDDDATNAAAATLAQFDLTGKQIEMLLPLMQDYATATGKDLNTAATDLGKALLGQTRALKEVGINYKSTGDRGQDFANITALLSEKVGGFAENEGKTAAGQLAILKNQFGEMQETIGGAVVPALMELGKIAVPVVTTLANALAGLVEFVSDLPGPIKAVAVSFAAWKLADKAGILDAVSFGVKKLKQELAFASYAVDESGRSLSRMGQAASVAKSGLAAFGKALAAPALLAAAAALGSAIVDSFSKVSEMKEHAADDAAALADAIVAANGEITASVRDLAREQVKASPVFRELVVAGADYVDTLELMSGGTMASADSAAKLDRALGKLGPDQAYQAVLMLASMDAAKGLAKAQLDSVAAHEAAASATSALAAAQDEARDSGVATAKAWQTLGAATGDLARQQDEARTSGVQLKQQWDILGNAKAVRDNAVATANKLGLYAAAAKVAADNSSTLSSKADILADKLAELAGRTPTVDEATRKFNGALQDGIAAANASGDGFANMGAKLMTAKGVIDTTTPSGQKLYDTVTTLGRAAQTSATAAAALAQQTGGVGAAGDAAAKSMEQSRAAFLANARQMGLTQAQAKALADQYFGIPSQVATTVVGIADFNAVDQKLQALADHQTYTNIRGRWVGMDGGPGGIQVGVMGMRAEGGAISGGVPGRDSVHILAMPGEHVLTTDDVAAMGGQSAVYGFRKELHSPRRMATGGAVSPSPIAPLLTLRTPPAGVESLHSPRRMATGGAVPSGVSPLRMLRTSTAGMPPAPTATQPVPPPVSSVSVTVNVSGLAVGTAREVADLLARPVTEAITRQRRAGVLVGV